MSKPSNQLSFFEDSKMLVSIDPERNRYRFYALSMTLMADATVCVERRWGRVPKEGKDIILSKEFGLGKKESLFSQIAKAKSEFVGLLKQKERHGYVSAPLRPSKIQMQEKRSVLDD